MFAVVNILITEKDVLDVSVFETRKEAQDFLKKNFEDFMEEERRHGEEADFDKYSCDEYGAYVSEIGGQIEYIWQLVECKQRGINAVQIRSKTKV